MKLKALRTFLECLSFVLWIAFTIFSISLAGLGIEGIIFAAFMLMVSTAQLPVHFPLAMASVGEMGVIVSILWRQVGVDHLHYLEHDTPLFLEGDDEKPSRVLQDLIHEVESSSGYARSDARAKAKAWLMTHASSLDEEDILLARTHLGYLLPVGWGHS